MISLVVILGCAAPAACGDDGGPMTTADKDAMSASVGDTGVFGSLVVTLHAGDGVPEVQAGTRPGEIVDGWKVSYTKLVVALGDFKAEVVDPTGGTREVGDGATYIVDMLGVSDDGERLQLFDSVEVGASKTVGYSLVTADSSAEKSAVNAEDYAQMVKGRYSLYIEGTMTNPKGQSCTPGVPDECVAATTISFRWGLQAATAYRDCAGFEVEDGATTDVPLTLPGDRWFQVDFNDSADARRAQWIADADLDHDGYTTLAELEQIKASDLFPPDRYDLSGAVVPIETVRDFVQAQAHAIGLVGPTCRTGSPI